MPPVEIGVGVESFLPLGNWCQEHPVLCGVPFAGDGVFSDILTLIIETSGSNEIQTCLCFRTLFFCFGSHLNYLKVSFKKKKKTNGPAWKITVV